MDDLAALDRTDPARAARRARDHELVERVRAGEHQAFGQLYDEWFDRVFDVASRIVRQPDTAAEVTQEAFLSAWRKLDTLEDPAAFGGWVLRIARNGALNRTEREQRSRAVDQAGLAMIEASGAGASNAPSGFGVEDRLGQMGTPGAALEDQEIAALVWQAAEALPERDVEVLDLQLRHGLSPAEVGEMLGLNRNAANQLVHRVRGRLATAVKARVLWRGGEPSCEVLSERLTQAGVVEFGPEAVRVIERHVPGCTQCDERQRLRLEPVALFAALPIMMAPLVVKASTATSLAALGVPMHGSAFTGAGVAGAVGMTSPASQVGAAVQSGGGAHGGLGESVVQPTGASNVGGQVEALAPAHHAPPINLAPKAPPITLAAKPTPILFGVAAGIAVVVLLIGGGLWFSHKGGSDDVTAGPIAFGSAQTTTTNAGDPSAPPDPDPSVPPSSIVPFSYSGTINLPTTTAPGGGPSPIPPPPPGPPGPSGQTTTTSGGVVSPPESTDSPTTLPTDPTTTPTDPTNPTTQPTTAGVTTTTFPKSTFTLAPNTRSAADAWWLAPIPAGQPSQGPTLSWHVTGPGAASVTVTGPHDGSSSATVGSGLDGSFIVCPVKKAVYNFAAGSAYYCPGVPVPRATPFTYTLVVKAADGTTILDKQSVRLTVNP